MDISPIASTSVMAAQSAEGQSSVPSPVSPAAAQTGTPSQAISPDRLAQAVRQVNDSFNQMGQGLYASFDKDKPTELTVIKIVDKSTKETISQIPSKQIIALAQVIDARGVIGRLIHNTA